MKTAITSTLLCFTGIVFAACGNPGAYHAGVYTASGMRLYSPDQPALQREAGQAPDQFILYEGTKSDLVAVRGDCQLELDMDDAQHARVAPGTTCVSKTPTGSVTVTFDSGSIRFDEGLSTWSAKGSVKVDYLGATMESKFDEGYTLTRTAQQ